MNELPNLSFVIPVKNEQETLPALVERIDAAVAALDQSYEIIFVDDGSTDQSWDVIRSLVESRQVIQAIRFRRNFGKANALETGFAVARGSVIFTVDADLQDDPKEIGRFLAKLDEGYDIVVGWKKTRHDPWHKVLPSRIFNAMLSSMTGTRLHDHNCGFKCCRAEVVKELSLYGEMHRMIPALGSIRGFKSAEIEVTHHPRRFGRSKYGIERFLRGFMDMLTVTYLQNYRERPLHLMGALAVASASIGALSLVLGLLGERHAGSVAAMIIGGGLLASTLPLIGLGLVAELMVRMLADARGQPAIIEELTHQTSNSMIVPAGSADGKGVVLGAAARKVPTGFEQTLSETFSLAVNSNES